MQSKRLETDRLCLRQWRKTDLKPFAKMNSNKDVMEYFPKLLSREESDALALKCRSLIDEKGWGFWAVSLKGSDTFIGFVGLNQPQQNLPFSPCVEIGWRLSKEFWGYGYATEAANACLKFAFEELKLDEVVSFTAKINERSQRVMKRLKMKNTRKNFYHPALKVTDPLAEHVLYKVTRKAWMKTENKSLEIL